MRTTALALTGSIVTALALAGCACSTCRTSDAGAHDAFGSYVAAINSNNLDTLTAMFTDDVVFMAPGSPPIVGKAAVRDWCAGYLDAFITHWDKTSVEMVVDGDHAWERYSYRSTDTPRAGGDPVSGTGWGLVIYRREADGVWRVARDAFGPDGAM